MNRIEFNRSRPTKALIPNLVHSLGRTEGKATGESRLFRPNSLESLPQNFIGPDIEIENKIIVPPLSTIEGQYITVRKSDLPAIQITREVLMDLRFSGRSSYAQRGIDFEFLPKNLTDEVIKGLSDGKVCYLPVLIHNRSERAVLVEGNIMRFFYLKESTRLRGENLIEALKSGELIVKGEENVDWFMANTYWNDPDALITNAEKNTKALLVLKIKERFHIPSSSDPLLVENIKGDQGRSSLSGVLEKIEKREDLPFDKVTIGETVPIIAGNLVLVINTIWWNDHFAENKGEMHGGHIVLSNLVDPQYGKSENGKTLRTETVGDPEYIELAVYQM